MNYTIETNKSFKEVIQSLQEKVAANGFRVLHIHDVQQTLKEKGFDIDAYSIVEVCNAKFANEVLKLNKEFGVMMPCKINVYSEAGKVKLTMMKPLDMVKKFGIDGLDELASNVEVILKKIMDESI
ncbi:MAG: DUF302 domain-containing protein [Ignavibacteria bacterium]|nr:DUF302 domain-containing protein [Ignavibacteria bacterium]